MLVRGSFISALGMAGTSGAGWKSGREEGRGAAAFVVDRCAKQIVQPAIASIVRGKNRRGVMATPGDWLSGVLYAKPTLYAG
jgi:hypothetical protein